MDQLVDYLPAVSDLDLPKLLVVCDFEHFVVRDTETGAETRFALAELPARVELFAFLAGYARSTSFEAEEEANLRATGLLATIHDELLEFRYPAHDTRVLLVRLLYCLFADDTGVWAHRLFEDFIDVMLETGTLPEFECFDVGIVRCVEMYVQTGMYTERLPEYNFVMGVESGMPADPDLLPILLKLKIKDAPWQATVIGRSEIWPVHRRTAELGGHLRSGLEDTFYLPDGSKVTSNAPLIEQLATYAREAGRAVASPAEARQMLGLAVA